MLEQTISLALLLVGTPLQIESDRLVAAFTKGEISVMPCKFLPGLDLEGKRLCVNERVHEPLLALMAHAEKDGFQIKINYAFRDMKQQKRLYRQNRRLAAKPGHSNHQSGLSVDIAGTRVCHRRKKCSRTDLYRWLTAHAPKYGFVNDIPKEPWHFTFIGKTVLAYSE